jgi:hypothetical protein
MTDQSARIEGLVLEVRQHAGERIFANSKILAMPMDDNKPNLLNNVWRVFEDNFPEAVKRFNRGTTFILIVYMEALLEVYIEQLLELPKTLSSFLRFAVISIVAGIDRAMWGFQKKDDLFTKFKIMKEDAYFDRYCKSSSESLARARSIYYGCFRRDGFNPLKIIKTQENDDQKIESDQQRELDYWKSKQEAEKKKKEISQEPQQTRPLPFTQSYIDSTQPGRSIIKKQASKKVYVADDDDDDDDDDDSIRVYAADQDGIRVKPGMAAEIKTGESGKSVRYEGSVPFKIAYEGAESQNKDEFLEDESRPTVPVHIADKIADPYFSIPLTKEGKVFDPNNSYKEVPPKPSDVWEKTLQGLSESGCDPGQLQNIMATSAAMAQVATMLTSDYKKKNALVYEEIPPPPKKIDLSTDSFDYDINGESISEVLGRRFCKTRFSSEPVRKMVMRNILQKVANHPKSSYTARMIAVGQLGKDDPLVRGRAEIHALINSPRETDYDLEDIIPPPRLGKYNLTSEVLKSLFTRLGMSQGERYDLEDLTLVQLKNFWMNLREVITSFGLREKEAYALLRRLLKGNSSDAVWLAEMEHHIPFTDYWVSLQKTQKRVVSSTEFKKKLENLINREPSENLEKTLNQILILNDKIFQKEADPNVRKLLCQRATLKDFRTYIRNHYSPYLSQINTAFADKQRSLAITKNMPSYTNELIYTPGLTYAFLEVCSEVLADVEPDAPKERFQNHERNHFRKTARIHAIDASPDVEQEVGRKQNEEGKNTDPELGRQERKKPFIKRNQGNFSGPRGPSRPENQGANFKQGSGPIGPVKYSCHLCNGPNHSFRQCRVYPGEIPGNKKCPACFGCHTSACRQDQEMGGAQKSFGAQIMEMNGVPNHMDNRNRPRPGGYGPPNGYVPPLANQGTPNGYAHSGQDNYGPRNGGNNYNGGFNNRGWSRFTRPDDRGYTNNYPRGYNQQDFSNGNSRPYNVGRSNYKNGLRANKSNYRQGGPNRYMGQGPRFPNGGQQEIDQRHISQLEDMLKTMKQQKLAEHVPEGRNFNGLGNGGHQPLNSSVVIDAMEQYFGSDSH